MRINQSPEAVSNILADLSEMELKKILIDKMEGNKSIQRSDKQQNLYKTLVKDYDTDKTILDPYGESAILKRRREDDDDQKGPSARSDRGSKRQREGGEHASAITSSEPATRKEPMQTTCQMEEPSHPMFETAAQGNAQSWISALAKQTDAFSSFNELLDSPIDFSSFIMNQLDVDTLTPELLAGPTYELMRGSCNSLTELEYHLEEVYKATMDQLDWVNHKGQHLTELEYHLEEVYKATTDQLDWVNHKGQHDGMLNDVRNALDDHLKGIRIQYLPTTIWRKGDKDRAAAMIQANDKMLKTRRIMRILERFVGGRQYEGDFQML
nr:hypothetical protein [Tanacetum cinerariifolium]